MQQDMNIESSSRRLACPLNTDRAPNPYAHAMQDRNTEMIPTKMESRKKERQEEE
jgi:hypothetical protein